jgi:hypothetical protein
MIDAPPPTSVQVMLRARIGVISRPSYLRPNIPQFYVDECSHPAVPLRRSLPSP